MSFHCIESFQSYVYTFQKLLRILHFIGYYICYKKKEMEHFSHLISSV